jgi:serine/threonine protein kinase
VAEALEAARQIAMALDHAHKRGLIHRDVKPSNIMLAAGGRYVLTDFGTVLVETATRLTTQTGRLIGTAEYLSPEQANQQPYDHRVDVYALGVVLYEMLAGSVPFSGDNDLLVVYAHAHREPSFDKLRIDLRVPREVVAIVARAMHKQQAQRFASAVEMALEIERVLSKPATATTARSLLLRSRAARMAIGVVCLPVLIILVLLARPTLSQPARQSSLGHRAAQFHLCVVAFVMGNSSVSVLSKPDAIASTVWKTYAGQPLVVQGRSHDAKWLLVGSSDQAGVGWMRAEDGNITGSLNCIPEVPTVQRMEE